MPTGLFCCLVSTPTATLHRPSPTAFSEFLCPTPDWRSLLTSGHVEISSPNTLSGFASKQTKESSAWLTTYIVSHLHTTISSILRVILSIYSSFYIHSTCIFHLKIVFLFSKYTKRSHETVLYCEEKNLFILALSCSTSQNLS